MIKFKNCQTNLKWEIIERKIELEERLIDNLIEQLDKEDYKIEVTCHNIMKNRMLEGYYIEKMLSESKLHEEREEKLFGMAYRMMNAIHWVCQEELSLLEQLDTQKLKAKTK